MHIWLVTIGEPLPKLSPSDRPWRVWYLAELLEARGHHITWWTSSFDHFRKEYVVKDQQSSLEVSSGLTLKFLHGCAYGRNVSIQRYLNHLQISTLFTRASAQERAPDIIVASYPPAELCDAVAAYASARKVPLIVDVRDLWPDLMVARSPVILKPVMQLATLPMQRAARRALRQAASIVGITDSYLRWGLDLAGRDRRSGDAIIPLSYTGHVPAVLAPGPDDPRRLAELGVSPDKKVFWFSGTFGQSIDLATVIEAARKLRGRDDVQFVFSGSGDQEAAWTAQAEGLPNVKFTGWASAADLARLAAIAWVGLAAYRADATQSLPNKLFEYLSSGLPVFNSLPGEAADIVAANGVGANYRSGDPDSLVGLVEQLADRPEARQQMSANARRLFLGQYDPRTVYTKFADLIESTAASRK